MFERVREIERRKAAGELDESGFTLIELLIVIVVLGILAAVVVFALGNVTGSSAVSACNADAKTVETAVAAFQAQNPGVTPTAGNSGNLVANALGGPYLRSWPSSPTHYVISLNATTASEVDAQPIGGTAVNYDTETGTTAALGGCGAVK